METEARRILEAGIERAARGYFLLLAGCLVLLRLSNLRFYSGGEMFWKLIELLIIVAILFISSKLYPQYLYRALLSRGHLVDGKLVRGPDLPSNLATARNLGCMIAVVAFLEPLLARLLPVRMVNYRFELNGRSYTGSGSLFVDEELVVDDSGKVLVLTCDDHPTKNWVFRHPSNLIQNPLAKKPLPDPLGRSQGQEN